mmetsp:Transcript_32140/g.102372  ORF Transcript_32140/g.102372 Transcript_32140/m.102372 type:complete len:204 (-) Transcript_32140:2347-2958(-)
MLAAAIRRCEVERNAQVKLSPASSPARRSVLLQHLLELSIEGLVLERALCGLRPPVNDNFFIISLFVLVVKCIVLLSIVLHSLLPIIVITVLSCSVVLLLILRFSSLVFSGFNGFIFGRGLNFQCQQTSQAAHFHVVLQSRDVRVGCFHVVETLQVWSKGLEGVGYRELHVHSQRSFPQQVSLEVSKKEVKPLLGDSSIEIMA